MTSQISTEIKKRDKPNDVFYTPIELVNTHISMIDFVETDIWYDPFYGEGAYYNNFPTENKIWTEIAKGKDFFSFNEKCDIICSNPPYSLIDTVLKKSVELNPKCISYLIALHNLTAKRIEYMNTHGYYLKKLHMLKVYKWYGMSCIVIFEKNCNNCISFDRTVYKN
jgi:hypothetical protein